MFKRILTTLTVPVFIGLAIQHRDDNFVSLTLMFIAGVGLDEWIDTLYDIYSEWRYGKKA